MKLRMFGMLFGLFIALAPACGGDDETVDAGGGAADAGTGGTPDSGTGGTPDSGTGGTPDSGTGGGDAAVAP